ALRVAQLSTRGRAALLGLEDAPRRGGEGRPRPERLRAPLPAPLPRDRRLPRVAVLRDRGGQAHDDAALPGARRRRLGRPPLRRRFDPGGVRRDHRHLPRVHLERVRDPRAALPVLRAGGPDAALPPGEERAGLHPGVRRPQDDPRALVRASGDDLSGRDRDRARLRHPVLAAPAAEQQHVGAMARRVLVPFPTAWDERQFAAIPEEERARYVLHLDVPRDEDVRWDMDVLGYIESRVRDWRGRIDGVFSSSDYPGSIAAAAIASELDLPCASPRSVLTASHKLRAREIQGAVAPEAVPRFARFDPDDERS